MNAVGIDVSKGKSMVTILRPFGEIVSSPFEIKHTSSDIHSLIKLIHSIEGESRVVMEHTGRYYEALAHQLKSNDLARCKKFVIFFYIFIIFSFTFVSSFIYSVLGTTKSDMILGIFEKKIIPLPIKRWKWYLPTPFCKFFMCK